jgi:hypothetical protein
LKTSARFQEEVMSISVSESTSTSDLIALLLTGQNWEFAQCNNLEFFKNYKPLSELVNIVDIMVAAGGIYLHV